MPYSLMGAGCDLANMVELGRIQSSEGWCAWGVDLRGDVTHRGRCFGGVFGLFGYLGAYGIPSLKRTG